MLLRHEIKLRRIFTALIYETDALIVLAKDNIANSINSEGKLAVTESYARVLNQLLKAKQREVDIEHMQKQISKINP